MQMAEEGFGSEAATSTNDIQLLGGMILAEFDPFTPRKTAEISHHSDGIPMWGLLYFIQRTYPKKYPRFFHDYSTIITISIYIYI